MKIAILGCGSMGTALLEGFLAADKSAPGDSSWSYSASVRSQASVERVKRALGSSSEKAEVVANDQTRLAEQADVTILGCQSQDLTTLFKVSGLLKALNGKLVISLLAGESAEQLRKTAREVGGNDIDLHIAPVIPSIGCTEQDSVTLVAKTPSLTEQETGQVKTIFEKIGVVQYFPDSLMNAATAVGAVCHALSIVVNDAIVDASVAMGIPRDMAVGVTAHSLKSSNNLLAKSMTPESLKQAMSTPNGITINAVLNLENAQIRSAVAGSVQKAIQHANAMSG
ncbi:pyrroline-5-carboxylate reductase [Myriangium duriaei CBS 260.36]|uniref:Pyrroline-5-carboxylate reductase n=1 Tax=Myriangium duriaei CBS 260.36 TaxID=1168546 RepID=A0A9P4J5S1_9PEZI|nr:pyrroline-5-carboxylate reductase [Myriangium duriaei CBS 260.36]